MACRMLKTLASLCLAVLPVAARADDAPAKTEDVAIHGQATFVVQATPGFRSPYAGDNSLTPNQAKETFDATAFIGARPWAGAEI